jgi:hypothetical protein
MTDLELMRKIKMEAGDAIETACHSSSVPPAFVAALIANETGEQFASSGMLGASNARRFEKNVLAALWEVLLGRKAAYGSIGRKDLLLYILSGKVARDGQQEGLVTVPDTIPANSLLLLDRLASSAGLTQVMGYHVLETASGCDSTEDLTVPARSLRETIRLLAEFAQRYQLDLASEFPPLFTCWNTGSPNGKTFDPDYVENGLRRMQLYAGLAVAQGVKP